MSIEETQDLMELQKQYSKAIKAYHNLILMGTGVGLTYKQCDDDLRYMYGNNLDPAEYITNKVFHYGLNKIFEGIK